MLSHGVACPVNAPPVFVRSKDGQAERAAFQPISARERLVCRSASFTQNLSLKVWAFASNYRFILFKPIRDLDYTYLVIAGSFVTSFLSSLGLLQLLNSSIRYIGVLPWVTSSPLGQCPQDTKLRV